MSVKVVKLIPHVQISGRMCERIVEVPVPQIVEQLLEVPKNGSRDRILQRAAEQIVDVPAPRMFERIVEPTEIVDNDKDNDTLRKVPHLSNEGLASQARV